MHACDVHVNSARRAFKGHAHAVRVQVTRIAEDAKSGAPSDFLSSIELLIMDRADMMTMQVGAVCMPACVLSCMHACP